MDLFQKCYDYKRVDMAKAWSIYPYFHELNSDNRMLLKWKADAQLCWAQITTWD